jgi:hypothetical protein
MPRLQREIRVHKGRPPRQALPDRHTKPVSDRQTYAWINTQMQREPSVHLCPSAAQAFLQQRRTLFLLDTREVLYLDVTMPRAA